jgi:2-polyprenyl-3-methyl-5-hydroxy-6-metoxy-1,4-benzoquinol methylase
MVDYDYLEGYRDPQAYDLEDADYDEDFPLTEQLARSLGGPLLDLACGTGTMAIRMAKLGYEVTGVDIIPEMTEWASQKAAKQGARLRQRRVRRQSTKRLHRPHTTASLARVR